MKRTELVQEADLVALEYKRYSEGSVYYSEMHSLMLAIRGDRRTREDLDEQWRKEYNVTYYKHCPLYMFEAFMQLHGYLTEKFGMSWNRAYLK